MRSWGIGTDSCDYQVDDGHSISGCLPELDGLCSESEVAASSGTQVAGWMTLQNFVRDDTVARWKCTITISVRPPKSSAFTEKRCNVCSEAMACLEFCLQHTGFRSVQHVSLQRKKLGVFLALETLARK